MADESYKNLALQLQDILTRMESDTVGIDELTEELGRAYTILDSLRSRLQDVECSVKEVISLRNQFMNQ